MTLALFIRHLQEKHQAPLPLLSPIRPSLNPFELKKVVESSWRIKSKLVYILLQLKMLASHMIDNLSEFTVSIGDVLN